MKKLILFCVCLIVFYVPTACFGAAYTATGDGLFEAAATWGGGGWPDTAGDTFTIPAGMAVLVSQEHRHALGESQVNGTLGIATNLNNTVGLRFGDADLNVASGATLIMLEQETGGVNLPVESGDTAYLEWDTTADNASGVSLAQGAIFWAKGTLSGTTYVGALADDAESHDDDNDIKTVSAMGWSVGDELAIHTKHTCLTSTCYLTDVSFRKINAISGTSITLEAYGGNPAADSGVTTVNTGCGSTWTARVINLTRNVRVEKVDYLPNPGKYGGTNRPRIVHNATAHGNFEVTLSKISIAGHSQIDLPVGYNDLWELDDVVIKHQGYAFDENSQGFDFNGVATNLSYFCEDGCIEVTADGFIFANTGAYRNTNRGITSDADYFAIRYLSSGTLVNSTFTGDVYASYGTHLGGYNNIFNGTHFFGNGYTMFWGGTGHTFINCEFGWTPEGSGVTNVSDDW